MVADDVYFVSSLGHSEGVLTVFTSPMDNGRGESLSAHRFDPTIDEFVEWTIPDVQACRTAGAFDVVYFFPNFDVGTAPGLMGVHGF